MTYKFPNNPPNTTEFMGLPEGFHRVGCFLFPKEWVGQEMTAWKSGPSKDLRSERLALEQDFKAKQARAYSLGCMPWPADPKKRATHEALLSDVNKQANNARTVLSQFGRPLDSRIDDAEAYERRLAVETFLCEAIQSGMLRLCYLSGGWPKWEAEMAHQKANFSFLYSYAVVRDFAGRKQRHPVRFQRSNFDNWAQPYERRIAEYRTDPFEDQFVEWFKMCRDEFLARSERPTKDQLVALGQERLRPNFAEQEFSRLVDAAWQLFAPKEWRKGGRSKKPS